MKNIIQTNTTKEPLEPPDIGPTTTVYDWIEFFWNNLFPFLIWILAMIWIAYIVFYNSRVIGFILKHVMNRFVISRGYFHIGSFSLSTISGKIMFRDVIYITEDYTIRIQDGWIVFRWWLPYYQKDVKCQDFSHLDTRLQVLLNGLEVHIYNRSQLYSRLEKLFNLPSKIFGEFRKSDDNVDKNSAKNMKPSKYVWHDLIPVSKIEISTGRFVFGNNMMPSNLSFTFEEAYVTYTTKPAVSLNDLFTHIAKIKAENFKIILPPSPKYLGMTDEPPRFMGEGFVVFQTNKVDFYYYQDEPGLSNGKPEQFELANGDMIEKYTFPAWGLDVKCGKGTEFRYGPWADRQREHLYNFFMPQEYQVLTPTKKPIAGEMRFHETFDFRLSTLSNASIDILFTHEKETNAIHITSGPGSYLEVTVPWINQENGYFTHILGQLMHFDAATSLQFRSLAQSETLEFDVKICYPLAWNDYQEWQCSITGCKATVSLIYAHKTFFQSLIWDWAGNARPDIVHFIPYTWKFNIVLKEFELITLANENNWIDCSSLQSGENCQLAICGDYFEMSFDLPFIEYLPLAVCIKMWFQGESLIASIYLPEGNPHRDNLHTLNSFAQFTNRDNTLKTTPLFLPDKGWRNIVTSSNGWTDCWSAPIMALVISYTYWPMPPKATIPKESEIATPEKEEMLLSPMRPNRTHEHENCEVPHDFDPGEMEPEIIALELEVGPSVICLYGALFRLLWNIKENYVGESQEFTDFNTSFSPFGTDEKVKDGQHFEEITIKPFDQRLYRPLQVTVSVTLHDIHGHIVKACNVGEPPCPSLFLEKLSFEMNKTYPETKMQLHLSPLILHSSDEKSRNESYLNDGFLTLSSLQFRGHAMFSGKDRPLESETLEYAWLIEVLAGDISGRLTLPQFYQTVSGIEAFVLQVLQTDSSLQHPVPFQRCLHDLIQPVCPQSTATKLCPYPEDLKYRMVRLSFEEVDVCFVETKVALSLNISPIKMSTCNLHSCQTSSGLTAVMKKVESKIFMLITHNSHKRSNDTTIQIQNDSENWLEVGSLSLGPLFLDSATLASEAKSSNVAQDVFLKSHDLKTKRLWFFWGRELDIPLAVVEKCGCLGGCAFFGSNKEGFDFYNVTQNTDLEFLNSKVLDEARKCDVPFGESILNRGELIITKLKYEEEDNDTASLDLMPFIDLYGNSSVSPSLLTPTGQTENSFKLLSEDKFSADFSDRKFRESLFKRQLSSPAHSSAFTIASPSSHGNLANLSPSPSPGNSSQLTYPSPAFSFLYGKPQTETKRKRGLSDSENYSEELKAISEKSVTENKEATFVSQNVSSSLPVKKVGFENLLQSTRSGSLFSRTKSFDSASSASERYFSAEDLSMDELSDGSSETIKSDKLKMRSDSLLSDFDSRKLSLELANYESVSSTPVQEEAKADTTSLSSNSFLSAISSQEDIRLIDLHNQMEKPVVESPLLMSAYSTHLSRCKCRNWETPFHLHHFLINTSSGTLYRKLRWKTRFKTKSFGFSCLKFVNKGHSQQTAECDCQGNHDMKCCDIEREDKEKGEHSTDFGKLNEEEKSGKNFEIRSEKCTILLKLLNEIDIKLSPLVLECTKTFVDALVPTIMKLHPLSVVNHYNLTCFDDVESHNLLKKAKTRYVSQLRAKALQSTLQRQSSKKLQAKIRDTRDEVTLLACQFDEIFTNKIQICVHICKVNLNMIQASIVEDFIAFSALDSNNVKNLTCVSVLSTSITNSSFKFSSLTREKRALHTFLEQPSEVSTFTEKALMSRLFSKKPKKERRTLETVVMETQETEYEERMCHTVLHNLQIQLSRLKNDSTILKEALLTVIPYQLSQVGFKLERNLPTELQSNAESIKFTSARRRKSLQRQQACLDHEQEDIMIIVDSKENEHLLDFIMFECGLDEISIKGVVKKSPKLSQKDKDDIKNQAEDPNEPAPSNVKNLVGDLQNSSSCVAEVSAIWFNFAAPPRTPNTRKIDFTRLEWHLLSTAAPSINAWLCSGDRLLLSLRRLQDIYKQRTLAVMNYLMTSALEVPNIHNFPQTKYLSRHLTPFSKTLQEDPSCQLIALIKRYLKGIENIKDVETNLSPEVLPKLEDLEKGVIALCRQWKNALYMPLLIEQNIKLKSGGFSTSNIPLRVLLGERIQSIHDDAESIDDIEVVDETTNLLASGDISIKEQNIGEEIMLKSRNSNSSPDIIDDGLISTDSLPARRKHSTLPLYFPRSNRPSIALPFLSAPFETIGSSVGKAYGYFFSPNSQNSAAKLVKRNGSQASLKSCESSNDANLIASAENEIDGNYCDENLYWWMSKQQDYLPSSFNAPIKIESMPPYMDLESRLNTLTSGNSIDHETFLPDANVSFLPMRQQVGDVRIVFQALLNSLNAPLDTSDESCLAFGSFGSKISICAVVKLFKIDIAESDTRDGAPRNRSPSYLSPNRTSYSNTQTQTLSSKLSLDAAAFICDNLSVEVDLRKVKDFEKTSGATANDDDKICPIVIIGPEGLNQFTTVSNFTIGINHIIQRVNLPLLRLLHQFAAVYENVKQNRLEMKANRNQFLREDKILKSRGDNLSNISTPSNLSNQEINTEKGKTGNTLFVNEDNRLTNNAATQQEVQKKCWKTMLYLLDLYETKPQTKTIQRTNSVQQPVVSTSETKINIEEPEYKATGKYEPLKDCTIEVEDETAASPVQPKPTSVWTQNIPGTRKSMTNVVSTDHLKNITNALMQKEWTPVVLFGVARIKKVSLVAMLSGLKLDGELTAFHVSLTHKQKGRGSMPRRWHESSLTGQLGQTTISLLEEDMTSQQLVVKLTAGKSQTLISSQNKKGKDMNSALLTIGPIVIDLPQHPVAIHGMMTRSGRQITTTLQELRTSRQPSRSSRQQAEGDVFTSSYTSHQHQTPRIQKETLPDGTGDQQRLIKPIVVQFSIILDSFTIGASLLPSLRAQYQIGQITSSGVTGNKAKFTVDVHQHKLSFNTKVLPSEANLPSSATVELPQIHISAEYMEDLKKNIFDAEGIVLRAGGYLNAVADIASFEHSLTTDLLNHLLFVQKVFMKEVNEVVQKMAGSDIKSLSDNIVREKSNKSSYILFTLNLRLKGIQITATTPSK